MLEHARRHGLDAQEGADDIDPVDPLPELDCEPLELGEGDELGDGGVRDEHADRPEPALHLPHHLGDGLGLGDVGLDGERAAAGGLDLGAGALRLRL